MAPSSGWPRLFRRSSFPEPCLPRTALTARISRSTALLAGLVSLLDTILAPAPDALVLADAPPAAILALAPLALVLADAPPVAIPARAPPALVLAEGGPAAILALGLLAMVRAQLLLSHSLHSCEVPSGQKRSKKDGFFGFFYRPPKGGRGRFNSRLFAFSLRSFITSLSHRMRALLLISALCAVFTPAAGFAPSPQFAAMTGRARRAPFCVKMVIPPPR